jgi:hypothetical protein
MPFGNAGDGEIRFGLFGAEGGTVGGTLGNCANRFRVDVGAVAFTAVADETDAFTCEGVKES